MSAIEAVKEKLEHAAHGAHAGEGHEGHGSHGKAIGVTMAILGVLLALCAALLGSERTELMRGMVEQSNKLGVYQAETTKYRVMLADYQLLKAMSPKPAEIERVKKTLQERRGRGGKEDSEDTAEIKELIAASTEDMAELLTPDVEDKQHFYDLAARYKHDMAEAKEDAEVYDLKIRAHEEGAEGYERAQVGAEIGIVIASVALLLASRRLWYCAMLLGAICTGLLGFTFVHTHAQLIIAEQKIVAAAANSVSIEADDHADDGIVAKPHGNENHGSAPSTAPHGTAPHGH